MEATLLKEKIINGELDDRILELYVDSEKVESQKQRYLNAIDSFISLYGNNDVRIFSAPGRSEIGGNHTDHQKGMVLAASINLDAIGIVSKVKEPIVSFVSDGFPEVKIELSNLLKEKGEEGTTVALAKGVLAGLKDRGFKLGGFCAYITSDVLIGAGLSSSAAFETLLGEIVSGMFNEGAVDAVTNAIVGQYAENIYFGKPCGLMDQMACSVGNLVYIDFENPKEPYVKKIEFDLNSYGYSLCITDTKGSHADLTDEYAAVPAEMKKVASFFGKEVLRQVSSEELLSNMQILREKYGDRAVLRALHFMEENKRVGLEVEALEKGDIAGFLKLVEASGNSSYKYLQNVYTNKDILHQNVSVALAVSEMILKNGFGVCRVHGGGFAGTIQAFVKNNEVNQYVKQMNAVFGEDACKVLKIRQCGGTLVV